MMKWEELHSFVKELLKSRECPWCHQKERLVEHHYPIPERLGGISTVKICQRCHSKDHNMYPDELIQRLIDEIEGRRSPDLNMFGEDPHEERRKLVEEELKRIEEEEKKQLKFLGGRR